ncbi:hypothetical protein MLD38_029823 [Melastoma candidum]|uniref:Uncharacterized protein n=1 Tax=Melastoma candidum TaxID=119954 RepID=A0ACB9N504_9MYRT|nr:hypothetical protein MLD38_029823 [Melastoma candidum]
MGAVVVAVSLATCFTSTALDTTLQATACSNNTYDPSMIEYAQSVEYVLDDMETVTANHPGYHYQTRAPYPTVVAYGHSWCNLTLTVMECVTCMSSARAFIKTRCPNKVVAAMILKDCAMGYSPFSL